MLEISGLIAVWGFYTVEVGIGLAPKMLEHSCFVLGIASTPTAFSELGRPHDTLLVCAAFMVGELIAATIDHRVWHQAYAQEQALVAELAEVAQMKREKRLESEFFAMTCRERREG
jgi:hypothetical protein